MSHRTIYPMSDECRRALIRWADETAALPPRDMKDAILQFRDQLLAPPPRASEDGHEFHDKPE